MTTGVIGASSMVGQALLPILVQSGNQVIAYSRKASSLTSAEVEYRHFSLSTAPDEDISDWICLAPIWVLSEHFPLLEWHHAKRIVALSSTSVFTKQSSSDPTEQEVADRLLYSEQKLIKWAEQHDIEWVILRPTLIYGRGKDRNISEIANFIRRFGLFPLLGAAAGLRQPVHADDVAKACAAALQKPDAQNMAYNLSGAEVISYRDMVTRVFIALGKRPHFLRIPLILFRIAITCLRFIPRYRKWTPAMAERMNQNLTFDHSEANRWLSFEPRPFTLTQDDLP